MSDDQRHCLDCPADITSEHWNRKRCAACSATRTEGKDRRRARLRHITIGPRLWPGTCLACGVSFESARRTQKYCSHSCSKSVRSEAACPICSSIFESYAARPAKYCSTACKSWAVRNGCRPSTPALACGWCAQVITDRNRQALYCSDRCMRTSAQARRAGKGAGTGRRNAVLALHIFERDNWTCHLCGLPVDPQVRSGPQMPSLDHLIPVAHPDYPGHLPYNLATTHLRCNSRRSDLITPAVRELFESLAARYGVGDLAAPSIGKPRLVTHCSKGHAYDPTESYPGTRYCRVCNRDRARSAAAGSVR